MSEFFQNVSPRRAILDLWKILGAPSEFRLPALALAAIVTGSIFWGMAQEGGRALPHPPKVLYFNSWRADRTDKDIIAGNIKAAREAKAEAAAEEVTAEDVRQMYKSVGAATGLDTNAMYKQGKAERIAEAKALAAHNKALLDRYLAKGAKPVVDPDDAAPSATPTAD